MTDKTQGAGEGTNIGTAVIKEAFNGASGTSNLMGISAISFMMLILIFFMSAALMSLTDIHRHHRDKFTFGSFAWPVFGIIFVIAFFYLMSFK